MLGSFFYKQRLSLQVFLPVEGLLENRGEQRKGEVRGGECRKCEREKTVMQFEDNLIQLLLLFHPNV